MDELIRKQNDFVSRYESGREADFLWQYIPKKLEDAIDFCVIDADGYWLYLAEGYTAYDGADDCRTIHCYTVSDLKHDMKTIRRIA